MSNDSFKVTLHVSPSNVLLTRRGLQKGGIAQKYVDSEVLRCCDSYVPMLSGKLKESGTTHTVVGSGMVHYDTIYGKKNYYGNKGMGNQGLNRGGKRGRLWFERMKPDHLPKILNGVKKIVGAK